MDCSQNDDDRQINKLNGQCITELLSKLGGRVTKNELLKHFVSTSCTQPSKVDVQRELSRVLSNGVSYGFIMKIGDEYSLPSQSIDMFQIDADVESSTVSDPDTDWEDLEDVGKAEDAYVKVLEDVMQLRCRLLRIKLLDMIINSIVQQKTKSLSGVRPSKYPMHYGM